MALIGKSQNKPAVQLVPSKPPQVLPAGLPEEPLPAVPVGQSLAVGQSSPTTPELLQPLAPSASGESAKMGNNQAQCARETVRCVFF